MSIRINVLLVQLNIRVLRPCFIMVFLMLRKKVCSNERKEIILKQIEILQTRQETEGLNVDELIRLSAQITTLLSLLDKYNIAVDKTETDANEN